MEKYRNNHNSLDSMTIHDLEDLVYTVAKRVENQAFGGLIPFFNRLFDENEKIMEDLEYIKSHLQGEQGEAVPEGFIRVEKDGNVSFLLDPTNEILKNAPPLNLDEKQFELTPEAIKNLESVIKKNQVNGEDQ